MTGERSFKELFEEVEDTEEFKLESIVLELEDMTLHEAAHIIFKLREELNKRGGE